MQPKLVDDKLTNEQVCKDRADELIALAKTQGLSVSDISPFTIYTIYLKPRKLKI
jgi:hypothetical protein